MEQNTIAVHKPDPVFLLMMLMPSDIVEREEARGALLSERCQRRNRRATIHRSHLYLIPLEKLFPGRNDILVYKHPTVDKADVSLPSQRRPRPDPHWKIPVSQWPTVLYRIDQGEPLRKVASDYGVSYETVRRIIHAASEKTG